MMNTGLAKENGWRYSASAPHKTGAGIATPSFIRAHNRASAVFLRAKHSHIRIMVSCVGQPQGWPGSRMTGCSNPAQFTTHEIATSGGELINLSYEDAIMATVPALVHPEITIINGQAVTSSLAVAEYFRKPHKDVLAKISRMDCSVEFTDSTGRTLPMYQITKNGFVFLVMGFTGKRAATFKEDYIAEFDRMENELRLSSGGLIKSESRTVVVHFDEAGNVISTERVSDDAVVTTLSQFKFRMERNGWLVIHRDDIRQMTVEQLISLK